MMIIIDKSIQNPTRYIGGEFNACIKNNAQANILLAFPDIYEVGMSNYGLRLLYDIVNRHTNYSAERVFMPWLDMFNFLKNQNQTLKSIETKKSFWDFDAIGFSIGYEMLFTSVIAMLEVSGLQVFREQRTENHPIIIAGGNSTFNPAVLSKFIDVFVIGDGDEIILEIMAVLANYKTREDRLYQLSKLTGIYVPSIHTKKDIILKNTVSDFSKIPLVEKPIIPFIDLIHNRLTYEVQRGCNRGCRFCQAGMIYRPVRQRDPEDILKVIDEDLRITGYREIGFLSLNACDYPPLIELIDWIDRKYKNQGIKVSLPSLRIESIDKKFLDILARLPKSGFTIAPEAGSTKLRNIINKDISEDEIIETVSLVNSLGWSNIKSYFMAGLPLEEDSDLEAIIDLAFKMEKKLQRNRDNITISVSNFVPKPHTVFEREKQCNSDEYYNKIGVLLSKIRGKRIQLKWADAKMSEIEGILARGDEKISELLYLAYKKGQILTSWNENFKYDVWIECLKELNISKQDYLDKKIGELPWSNISTGVSNEWLSKEQEKYMNLETTSHCLTENCSACGICKDDIKNIRIEKKINFDLVNNLQNENKIEKVQKIRACYTKLGVIKWLSHFDLMSAVEKAIYRGQIPVNVSQGFTPRPALSFSPPLPSNVESYSEIFDIILYKKMDLNDFINIMNQNLPEGVKICSAHQIALNASAVTSIINKTIWSACLKKDNLKNNIESGFFSAENKIINTQRKSKDIIINIFDFCKGININVGEIDVVFSFEIQYIEGRTVKPIEVLKCFVDFEEYNINLIRKEIVADGISYGCKQ